MDNAFLKFQSKFLSTAEIETLSRDIKFICSRGINIHLYASMGYFPHRNTEHGPKNCPQTKETGKTEKQYTCVWEVLRIQGQSEKAM